MDNDQEECMAFAAPLLKVFSEGWHDSMTRYRGYDAAVLADHDDSTAASNIRSHMWPYVQNNLGGMPGIAFLNVRNFKLINYFDRHVYRLKKVDGSGWHSNYRTAKQDDFDDQITIPELPPEAKRLTVGYQPDAAGESVERVIIAKVMGQSVAWLSQINFIDDVASWEDITPSRLPGIDRVDFRSRRSGQRR